MASADRPPDDLDPTPPGKPGEGGEFMMSPDRSAKPGRPLSGRAVTILIALAALLFCAAFLLVLKEHFYHYDDAFITYTFARNLAEGHGFVYHPELSQVQGSSSPFYTVLLAALSRVTSLDVHVVGEALGVFSFLIVIAAVFTLVTRELPALSNGRRLALFFLGLTFQAPLALSFGLEICLVTGCLLYALFFILEGRNTPAALCLLVIPVARLDYLFYFPAFGLIALLLRRGVSATTRLFTPAMLMTAGYVIFARFYFGEYVPHTWIAKTYIPESVSGVLNWLTLFTRYPSLLVFVILGTCVIVYALLLRERSKPPASAAPSATRGQTEWALLLLTLTSVLYTLILRWKGAPNMPWYFVTTLVFFFALMSRALALPPIRGAVQVVLLAAFFGLGAYGGKEIPSHYDRGVLNKLGHNDRREKIGILLRENYSSIDQRTILCYEIGKIAYYSRAVVHDMLGLVSPEAIAGLKAQDSAMTLRSLSPDFVIGAARPNRFPMTLLSSRYFIENYTQLTEVDRYRIWQRNDRVFD